MKFSNPFHPPPAPPAFGTGKVLPEYSAPYLSRLVFQWLAPFLNVGYSRPLEKEDLWELPHDRLTAQLSDRVEFSFFSRCPPEKRPWHLREKLRRPDETIDDNLSETVDEKSDDAPAKELETSIKSDSKPRRSWFGRRKRAPKKPKSKYDSSLVKALFMTFRIRWLLSGLLKLCADTLKTTTPLVNKVLLTWLTESYLYAHLNEEERASGVISRPQGIGYGIGIGIAVFAMQEVASIMTNHYMQITLTNGLAIRTGLIGNIFRKSLRLSGRSKSEHSVGKITTMISTDATRLDLFSSYVHNVWIAPIQIIIGIGLLIGQLGYSALVGLGVLILGFPVQLILIRIMFKQRRKGVKITDSRVRLTTEILQGVRLIKSYAWEEFYTSQIGNIRRREIKTIKKIALARSVAVAFISFIPILASVLSFITYSLSGHQLNVAVIFTSLQFFNIIRQPMIMLPIVLSSMSDALVALGRIQSFLAAEELAEPYKVDYEQKHAVQVDGDFTWETAGKIEESKFSGRAGAGGTRGGRGGNVSRGGGQGAGRGRSKKSNPKTVLPVTATDASQSQAPKTEEKPFELVNLKFSIPKGSFVAIVGRVGSGKSSILQALIGEMRRTRGEVVFGGSCAYVPQTPWIRNATLKENVLFGQEEQEDRFQEVIHTCSLERDLDILPQRELTEIGEKGINLSGGQKARVSLARAAYSTCDTVLLDDPLSAVDSHVGKAILEKCLLNGPLADRTRILVTHALHVLDKTDYIFVVDGGQIKEQGSYQDLMRNSILFSRLMEEYGSQEKEKEDEEEKQKEAEGKTAVDVKKAEKKETTLMQQEERNTGAVSWTTYKKYLQFAGSVTWGPFILTLLICAQVSQVGNTLFLGFWTGNTIPGFHQGQYMAVYAGLGVSQAVFQFLITFTFAIVNLSASFKLFRTAFLHVLRSPVSFFDTTPMGRVLSRLSKDQDTLDNQIATTMMQLTTQIMSVLGTIALVFYVFPYLGLIFIPLSVLYYLVQAYYRRTSVETKRLDSLMRSALYSSYSETLTGLSTIRAYREQARAIDDAQRGLDMENRAYYMTISIQRWLGIRLDIFGNILILGITLFAAGFRTSANPSNIGVVLTYTLSITQLFSDMVSMIAQNEQNMNAVERILVYSELPSEGDPTTPNDPPPSWPDKGEVRFSNVELAYRPGLPLVLQDISFHVKPGEKIGIVGRTGAGKSSIVQALLRMVEVQAGKIEIDGVNTRNIGLDTLRGKLALVPQDSILFLGTLRENLDPLGTRTDAEIISLLQRAWLLPHEGPVDPVVEAKFSLDSTVGDEGSNFSAGEKQLLALCRALVKNSRIIILDEATSSVDVETDAKIQSTIQTEFADSTLLCIAHRLNTIAYYDRIMVMDAGKVAEFDTVLNLFDKEDSIFRSLCDEANLQRSDILRIRASHGEAVKALQ
ncbi:multidrug resistance-associated ABC transporter [Dendrothele bispora CBS 962.96]|uniref:Multidrug resistance-associated ABC transporter n=1 Tax=Dendrothele bispora (strain CBS 962.96) TaxID=1314807 RepID=A0A4S8LXK1_DENBC|nr:multidrug resistance-associated ABC transporter [Dendrothele bispora CBS 962.96]